MIESMSKFADQQIQENTASKRFGVVLDALIQQSTAQAALGQGKGGFDKKKKKGYRDRDKSAEATKDNSPAISSKSSKIGRGRVDAVVIRDTFGINTN